MIFRRVHSFREHGQDDVGRAVKNRVEWAEFIPEDQMQRERQTFRTIADHCACGQPVLRSTFYRTHIPCCHQINISVAQSKLSDEIIGFPNKNSRGRRGGGRVSPGGMAQKVRDANHQTMLAHEGGRGTRNFHFRQFYNRGRPVLGIPISILKLTGISADIAAMRSKEAE
jgi:hypothetical protein